MDHGDEGSKDVKRRKIENGAGSVTSGLLSLPPKIVYHIISYIPLHEQFIFREISKRSRELGGAFLRALPRVDLSPYPTLVNEELTALIQITNQSTFLDVSNCKYISYETASHLAATYPNLIMKVDNSLFNNKHRLKKDTALVKSLYKLVWNDDAISARVLSQFQNLRKLDMSVCEVNLTPLASHPVGLGYIRFLKLTNVAFTKPNMLHNLLKSSTALEVLVVRDCNNVTEHDFEPVVNHLNLFKLAIRGRAMNLATWQRLAGHERLKKLGIDMLPDAEGADECVAKVLAGLPKLKSLILGVKLVNDDFIETLSQYKNPFSNIKKLYLGDSAFDTGCVITEDGVALAGQLFPNCEKILLSGVENITAFAAFSLVEELQVYGGSYDTAELQNIISTNKIEKLTLEHVSPDDEGEVPLVVKSKTLETFTTSKEEFDITIDECPELRSIRVSNEIITFVHAVPKLEYFSMPWPEDEAYDFTNIIDTITAQDTPVFLQIIFSGFEGGLEDLKPFFDRFNGNVCAVHYQEKEQMWYSSKGGSLMGSLNLAVKFGIPYNKETDKQETETEVLEEGVVAYRKFPAKFFEEMSSASSEEEKAELARELGVWDRCLFIEASNA
eukprot:Phypoly_transcript_03437.p1 GENE.Phypoly_transcript_03437~~Phypoly_transcript_03437.p1  ORF type:complete len:614 (+),score=121.79 Phypoly_transcript_03437:263-2104(+)